MKTLRTTLVLILSIMIGASPVSAEGVPDFRHLSVKNPARLSAVEAERLYDVIKQRQFDAFARAELETAAAFPSWRRYNRAPFISSTHGNRFINHYANDLAAGYDNMTDGFEMAVGAAFAKDSFEVQEDGTVRAGRLFIMEKLSAGASPSSDDWRYVIVERDGTIIGDNGAGPDPRVEFCHTCHKVQANHDNLFFVPPNHR